MRYESSVTSLSWIPREAVQGVLKVSFDLGVSHYDPPPPEVLGDLEDLRLNDRFRFANRLEAWIEVDDGRIVDFGRSGGGAIGSTTISLGLGSMTVPAVAYPDIVSTPEVTESSVRFVQTAGGRTGFPLPRRVRRPPFVQVSSPPAWSTLSLTLFADGSSRLQVEGASPFPRHWIYDHEGRLVAKTGLIDFDRWYGEVFGDRTPWGQADSPALLAPAVSEVELRLSEMIMRKGSGASHRRLAEGEILCEQGEPGNELYLLLDGFLDVVVDGEPVVQVGPGAVLGERAVLEGGRRTATLQAATPVRVAVYDASQVDRGSLAQLTEVHSAPAQ